MRLIPLSEASRIKGYMSIRELQWLRAMAINLPQGSVFVESGIMFGRSTVALAVPHVSLICVGTFRGPPYFLKVKKNINILRAFKRNMRRLRLKPTVMVMDTIEAAAHFEDQSIDGFFLDCGHSRFKPLFYAWLPKLRAGGIASGHDYGKEWPGIGAVLVESGYPYRVVEETRIWYFIKDFW